MALDHIVINTLKDMDRYEALFGELGFFLTPRGYHTLGSLNHLILEPSAYLELVGVPDTGRQRQEILDSPRGLNGLVLKSNDAIATFARLKAAGFEPEDPVDFSRPVTFNGQTVDAKFRTVRLPSNAFPAGRVYFCEHLTPELVWQEHWMSHPNGYCGISDILIDSLDPEAEATRYATLLEGIVEGGDDDMLIVRDSDFTIWVHRAEKSLLAQATLVFNNIYDLATRASILADVTWRADSETAGWLEIPSLGLSLYSRQKG